MISLEEHSKICNLLSSCNEMIEGKFILADYKIANILKNISSSKEVYNLIANQMNNFNFERELSKAQLRGSTKPNKFKLPDESEKTLPFIFCILVGIKNKELDFDLFLKEYYSNEKGRAEEYSSFASEIILPFRDIIAEYFQIPIESLNKNLLSKFCQKPEAESNKEEFDDLAEKYNFENDLNEQDSKSGEAYDDEINENICEENISNENMKGDEDMSTEIDNLDDESLEMAANKTEQFLAEVAVICKDIKVELGFDKRVNKDLKDDLIYITNIIISDCEMFDLKNVVALITAYEHMSATVRSIKFLTRELKKLVIEFYNE